MRAAKFLSISSLILLSACAKETVGYFKCASETGSEVPSRFNPKFSSLVVDTKKKTLVVDDWRMGYEENSPNRLVSKSSSITGSKSKKAMMFDTLTGRLELTSEFGGTHIYWCEKTEKLI